MAFPSRAWDGGDKKKGSVQLRKLLNFYLDVGCWMLDVGCWMLDVGCSYPFAFAPILPAHSLKSSRMI